MSSTSPRAGSTSIPSAGSISILAVDNFDSFTHNLVDDLRRLDATVETWRNDVPAAELLRLAEALPAPRLIVISPGPGRPEDAGSCEALIRLASGRVPIFGVCLGLQAMVQAFGGRVGPAGSVVHGKTAWIEHDGASELEGLPSPLCVGRYHSLVATEVPPCFEVSARYGELVMALRHREHPTVGVQFHPESLLTPRGRELLRGVTAAARRFYEQQEPHR